MSSWHTAIKPQSYETFIYNSAGVQTGNRYNSWSDLMTAIAKQEGAKTIYFEQDEIIPEGDWNLDYVTLRGNGLEYNAGGYTLTFGDNTTISSWLTPSFHSLLLKSTSTTGHICTFTYAFSLLCDTVSNVQSSATYEFFASSYAGQNIIGLINSARFSLIAGKPLFKFTGSAFAQTVILSRGRGAVVTNNTLSSTNAQVFVDIIGSVDSNNATYPMTNTGFTTGFFLPLTLTNISAAAFYVKTKAVADSPYTLLSEDGYLRCNAVGGNMTVNLPVAIGNGRLVTVTKTDTSAYTVTLDGNGSETIDGATTKVLALPNESIQMIDAAAGVWETINNDIGMASGTYTPTLTNVTNISASTAYACQYMRVGNVCTVSGKVDIDPTAAGAIELGMSLPIASNLAAQEQCAGTVVGVTALDDALWIEGDATNNRAAIKCTAIGVANHSNYFTFTYLII